MKYAQCGLYVQKMEIANAVGCLIDTVHYNTIVLINQTLLGLICVRIESIPCHTFAIVAGGRRILTSEFVYA